jgi:hypothetical protein
MFTRTRRALALASRPSRPLASPGNGVGALTGSWTSISRGSLTPLLIRCCCGRAASTRPVHGSSCRWHGGDRPPCKGRMAPSSSGDKGARKGAVSAPSSPISSCMTRAMPGCTAHSRPSPASALPRISSRLVRVKRQRAGCTPVSRPGWPSASGHCIRTRHPSCTARMRIGVVPSRTTAVTFWARRFAHDGPRIAGGSPVSTAVPR